MSLRSRTFLVRKGEPVDELSTFLQSKIGYDAYLVKSITATPLNDTVTQLTVIYQQEPDFVIDSFAPRPGAILYTGLLAGEFDSRIIFNNPIDPNSISSGAFIVDSIGLASNQVYIDPDCNNYYVKLLLSGSNFLTADYHEIRVDNSLLRKQDGGYFEYSPVGGYAGNPLSTSHIGDKLEPYPSRRRGVLQADVLRTSKGNSPQQVINEYLSQRGIEKERLVTYSFVARNDNHVEVYFIYLSRLEPQIIEGFPLTNTFLPSNPPAFLTLVFSTELDSSQIASTDGLFYIESDYSTSTAVSASDVTLLPDLRTIRIDLSSYMILERVYSILVKPGLRSRDGTIKRKPEQWVLYLTTYEATVNVSGDLILTGAPANANYLLHSSLNGSLPNGKLINANQGIAITVGGSSVGIGMQGSFYSGLSGHIENPDIHFEQSEISILSSQVTNFNSSVTTVVNNTISGHTGNSAIHFTQADIIFPLVVSGLSVSGSNNTYQGNVEFSGAGNVVVIEDPENGRILFSGAASTGSGAGVGEPYITYTPTAGLSNERILQGSQGVTVTVGASNVTAAIEGSFYSGLIEHTGSGLIHYTMDQIVILPSQVTDLRGEITGVITGTITNSPTVTWGLVDGEYQATVQFPLVVTGIEGTGSSTFNGNVGFSGAGTVVLIEQGNRIIFSGAESTGSGASTSEPYITWQSTAGLSNERILQPGLGISVTVGSSNATVGMHGEFYTGISGHLIDNTIHYTQGDISIPANQITNFGATVSGLIEPHTGNSTIHFTQSEISIASSQISNFGSSVSGLIDPHTGNSSIHFTQAEINHASLLNLTGDHHTQYVLDNGTRPFTGAVSMFASVTNAAHLAHKDYVDTQDTALIITAASLFHPINACVTGIGIHTPTGSSSYRPNIGFSGIGSVRLYPEANNLIYISGSAGGSVSDLDDLTDVDLDPLALGGLPNSGSILYFDAGSNLWIPGGLENISGAGGTSYYPQIVNFHSDAGTNITLTNQAQALQFLGNSNRNITKVDLTNCTEARLIARVVTASASTNSPRLLAKYNTSFSTTASTYSLLGNGLEDVEVSLGSATLADSGWFTIPGDAKADVFIAVFQTGGDGVADPALGNVSVQFR